MVKRYRGLSPILVISAGFGGYTLISVGVQLIFFLFLKVMKMYLPFLINSCFLIVVEQSQYGCQNTYIYSKKSLNNFIFKCHKYYILLVIRACFGEENIPSLLISDALYISNEKKVRNHFFIFKCHEGTHITRN